MFRIAYSPVFKLPLPHGHRFPMIKYELIPEQLLYEGTITNDQLFEPEAVKMEIAALVHEQEYLNKLIRHQLTPAEIRRSGFPMSPALIEREFIIAGGTCTCSEFAFINGIAMNVAGGTHHASSNTAEGFCLLNDQAIAAASLINSGKCRQILIVDLDVHQGNGTASIFSQNKQVFTFSMHAGHNFPLKKERSDLDISLPDGCNDQLYLEILEKALQQISITFSPDFIFYQSGVDVLSTDKLGRLELTRIGCRERDKMVMEFAKTRGIPIVITMGGGYSENIRDIVEAHCNTFRVAAALFD